MSETLPELDAFLESWDDGAQSCKRAFIRLRDNLAGRDAVSLTFLPRPGVTYSLRAAHATQDDGRLLAMVDVIEDQPRWLSVCFYNDMVDDPDQAGDYVPEGLLGEDALCFDLDSFGEDALRYVEARFDDAVKAADGS